MTLLREFCDEHCVAYQQCGKVLVALDDVETTRLADIADMARRNGVPQVRLLSADELREIEPHVTGVAGLHSPTTARVGFLEITRRLASDAEARGAVVRTSAEVARLADRSTSAVVRVGEEQHLFDEVVISAGLQGDRLAASAGAAGSPHRAVPRRVLTVPSRAASPGPGARLPRA